MTGTSSVRFRVSRHIAATAPRTLAFFFFFFFFYLNVTNCHDARSEKYQEQSHHTRCCCLYRKRDVSSHGDYASYSLPALLSDALRSRDEEYRLAVSQLPIHTLEKSVTQFILFSCIDRLFWRKPTIYLENLLFFLSFFLFGEK